MAYFNNPDMFEVVPSGENQVVVLVVREDYKRCRCEGKLFHAVEFSGGAVRCPGCSRGCALPPPVRGGDALTIQPRIGGNDE